MANLSAAAESGAVAISSYVVDFRRGNLLVRVGTELPATLGRAETNDIILINKSVSRQHAQIFLEKGKPFIKDLDSAQGTYVNGNKVTSSILSAGDLVKLGLLELKVNLGELETKRWLP